MVRLVLLHQYGQIEVEEWKQIMSLHEGGSRLDVETMEWIVEACKLITKTALTMK